MSELKGVLSERPIFLKKRPRNFPIALVSGADSRSFIKRAAISTTNFDVEEDGAYAREYSIQLNGRQAAQRAAEKFVPEKLHSYGLYYAKKENPEDDKRWFQISTLAMQQYPNHAEGFNDAAGYYADVGDWQKAREFFEKAHEIDPKSVGVLINLGNVSVEMKDFAGARKFFEQALKLDPNDKEAKEALRKLKKK